MSKFKSGFVALIGRPNVGKSSLINTIVGQKIMITSEKPQTTRNQLRGILTKPDYQIVWIDTPGLHRPKHELGNRMVKSARKALFSVDLALWLLDASMGLTAADQKVMETFKGAEIPILVIWNKIDLIESKQALPELPGFAESFSVSALNGTGIEELLARVVSLLPEGPAFYPPEMVTDHPERFVAAEFIREQVLHHTSEEIPHAIAVQVDEFKERENGRIYIAAVIHVERDSQKGIVIGANGSKLKAIGQAARGDLEEMLGVPVYLDLWVKVRKNWRNNQNSLKEFGYQIEVE